MLCYSTVQQHSRVAQQHLPDYLPQKSGQRQVIDLVDQITVHLISGTTGHSIKTACLHCVVIDIDWLVIFKPKSVRVRESG